MLGVEPEVVAHDLHPEYLSTKWALEQDAELVGVQHHHAHAAACLAEHGETGPALALVFDGTGLRHRRHALGRRAAALRPGRLRARRAPRARAAARRRGGDPRAVARRRRLPRARRPAACRSSAGELRPARLEVNAPLSSGMGRLFDAVAAVLGVRETVTYEGQAAIELEQLAGRRRRPSPTPGASADGAATSWRPSHDDLDARPAARRDRGRLPRDGRRARPPRPAPRPAASRARSCSRAARSRTSGCSTRRGAASRRTGFRVLSHRRVPPNDGGISYGQAAVAAARLPAG